MIKNILFLSALLFLGLSAPAQAQNTAFALTSPDFASGADIPVKYTCDGTNVSPALTWEHVPPGSRSLALIVEDPDAPNGTWTHWVAYNIPPTVHGLPENVPAQPQLTDGTLQGQNSFKKTGYSGPCPPQGKGAHRYFFRLYALSNTFNLSPQMADSGTLKAAIKTHTLGTAELMGRFGH